MLEKPIISIAFITYPIKNQGDIRIVGSDIVEITLSAKKIQKCFDVKYAISMNNNQTSQFIDTENSKNRISGYYCFSTEKWEKLKLEHKEEIEQDSNHNLISIFFDEYEKLKFSFIVVEKNVNTANFHNEIACNLQDIGDYDKAILHHLEAVNIYESLLDANDLRLAKAYHNFGKTYNSLFEYEKTVHFSQKSIFIKEQKLGVEHPDTAVDYLNVGDAFHKIGNYDAAMEFYQKSIAANKNQSNVKDTYLNYSYNSIAKLYRDLGKYEESISFFEKSIYLHETEELKYPNLPFAYDGLATVYRYLSNYEKALELHQKSIFLQENSSTIEGKEYNLCCFYNSMGLTYHANQKSHLDIYISW